MKTRNALLLGACLSACTYSAADAAVLFDYDGVATSGSRSEAAYTIGNLFEVGANDLSITHLGVMDVNNAAKTDGNNGWPAASIAVGIWTADGTSLLANASVLPTDTLATDGYRYVELSSPITLSAGTQYLIGANVGAGREYFLDDHPGSAFSAATSDITLISSNFKTGGTLAAPTDVGGGTSALKGRWGAANAQYTVVPEPGSLALIGLGGLLIARRRR